MPAVSKAQQKFFGMIEAFKKHKLKNPSPKVREAAKGLSAQDTHDFAATKRKGLPEHVKKAAIKEAFERGFNNRLAEIQKEAESRKE